LIRAGRPKGVARLDELAGLVGYLPLDTAVMRRAAELWARARNEGTPTAADAALDADVILSAQAQLAAESEPGLEVIVATGNVGHLARFVDARAWEGIAPPAEPAEQEAGPEPAEDGASGPAAAPPEPTGEEGE